MHDTRWKPANFPQLPSFAKWCAAKPPIPTFAEQSKAPAHPCTRHRHHLHENREGHCSTPPRRPFSQSPRKRGWRCTMYTTTLPTSLTHARSGSTLQFQTGAYAMWWALPPDHSRLGSCSHPATTLHSILVTSRTLDELACSPAPADPGRPSRMHASTTPCSSLPSAHIINLLTTSYSRTSTSILPLSPYSPRRASTELITQGQPHANTSPS